MKNKNVADGKKVNWVRVVVMVVAIVLQQSLVDHQAIKQFVWQQVALSTPATLARVFKP
jgi:uncharacterized protein (DUF983 family)